MESRITRVAITVALLTSSLQIGGFTASQGIGSCADDLDYVRRRAADANSAAESLASASRELESAISTARSKRSDADIRCRANREEDYWCRSAQEDARQAANDVTEARDEADSKARDLDSALDTVRGKWKIAETSCVSAVSLFTSRASASLTPISGVRAQNQQACQILMEYQAQLARLQIARRDLLSECLAKKSGAGSLGLSDAECRICAGPR